MRGSHQFWGELRLIWAICPNLLFLLCPSPNPHPLQKTFPFHQWTHHYTQDLCVSPFRTSQVWEMLCIQKRSPEVICGKIKEETKYAGKVWLAITHLSRKEWKLGTKYQVGAITSFPTGELLFFDILSGDIPSRWWRAWVWQWEISMKMRRVIKFYQLPPGHENRITQNYIGHHASRLLHTGFFSLVPP